MPDRPKVSVVMSVYNGESYLMRAVDSILKQTFLDFEFIIIDDGSTDQTLVLLEQYAAKDSRILLLRQKNQGLTRSLNRGCLVASGQYLARQDIDDESLPTRLQKQVAFLEANPQVVVLATRVMEIKADGSQYQGPFLEAEALHKAFSWSNPVAHSSVMLRLDSFRQAGFYDNSYDTTQDYEAWLRLRQKGKIMMLNEPLLKLYRTREAISVNRKWRQWRNGNRARWQYRHQNGGPAKAIMAGMISAIYRMKPRMLANKKLLAKS